MTTEYLLNEQLDRVLACLMPTNELICRVMLQTGTRISDILSLETKQLKQSFCITESKTGKNKRLYFNNSLLNELKAQAGKMWVFESRLDPKKHRTRQAVYYDLKRAAKAFRLHQVIGTHSLRKVYAVDLFNKHANIERVRRALNHGSTAVTFLYAAADKLLEVKNKKRGKK